MIGYIQGKILKKYEERILLLANQIGYEIMLPTMVMETLSGRSIGDEIELHVYYQQSERQPKPVLIGFTSESEKDFFQKFISVEDIGPMKAVKALSVPIHEIAEAIESKNAGKLQKLKGIGKRTAQKIIASLHGKMEVFLLPGDQQEQQSPVLEDVSGQVLSVLIDQLGYRIADARRMIAEAMKRKPEISSPEALFDEVLRGTKSE